MFKHLKNDLPASLVVFFVALPLCLGIALASGAPLFSGLIAGIVGGIVVGSISGSSIGVSGPAAGLAVIVLAAIASLGFENFLVAVIIGGVIQILLGVLKAGIIGYYFPSSVIKGMLAAIGVIIFLKQIPHAFGYDSDYEGDLDFFQLDGENTFSALGSMLDFISPGAILVTCISLFILLFWEKVLSKKHDIFKIIPGPLVAVIVGILYYMLVDSNSSFGIATDHLVSVPVPESASDFIGQFTFPNFAAITNPQVWVTGVTIAIVASLETLLCVEATDKMDPEKRTTPTNRELFAQGAGNIVSGFIGGLPITQVIVRSSANLQSGGKTKLSAIVHGVLLLGSVILIPLLLNKIPLAVLAAILLIVGYKLAKPALFKQMFKLGKEQFIPFIVTVLGVVFTDLLMGIGLGLAVGITMILIKNYQNSHFLHIEKTDEGSHIVKMTLAEEISFLNKGAILKELNALPNDTLLELDVTKTLRLNYDILEILDDFAIKAKDKNIEVKLISNKGVVYNPKNYTSFFRAKNSEAA
ncbi:MAG: SulP family inorganic anion transporter [Galbibacter orientalis]|uniref:SulP family inorganic anion transporter n=1 Tax=Galbibacter orientalis TaxID=453852 RepID=UPI003001B740